MRAASGRRPFQAIGSKKRAPRKSRRRLQVFVVMPHPHSEAARVHALLTTIAGELRDPGIKLVFAHQALSTHALLIKNLRRVVAISDVVLCFTDGRNPDVSFEAGVAFGLAKPLVVVILPGTWVMPETFAGHYCVGLAGDSTDHECLRSALARIARGGSIRIPRFVCAIGMVRSKKRRRRRMAVERQGRGRATPEESSRSVQT